MPEISVIVTTRDRQTLLERTLAHLLAQDTPPSGWELIVVDSSRSPLGAVDATSVEVRVVSAVGGQAIPRSAGAARNVGARLANAPRLCFLDDDMLASPGFVRQHLCGPPGDDQVLLGYRYLAQPGTVLPAPGAPFAVAADWLIDEREPFLRENGERANWGCLYSHNFSLTRRAFEMVGGFDESFAGCGGEDVELGYRLHRAGAEFCISRDAVALHQNHPRSAQRWRDNAANLDRLVELHPELGDFAAEVRRGWKIRPEFHAALADDAALADEP